jgi:enolase-phosphatase E1
MIQAILTDIEGTTSSIHFVKEVLFPYAHRRMPEFVARHGEEPEARRWLTQVADEAGLDESDQPGLVALLQQWIDEDRKHTALKGLQGLLWHYGYERGDYRAHVYPEVPARLREWKARGLDLYVYSSGSVAAQKLLFHYSELGDLTPLFSGYFDTQVGGKREEASYRHIARHIERDPAQILFLSDVVEELDAARAAGMATTWVCRAPLQCPAEPAHPCAADFDAVQA